MRSDDDNDDSTFLRLPEHLRHRIDRAFDSAIAEDTQPGPPRKRRKIDRTSGRLNDQPAGFFDDESQPGGFLLEEPQPSGFLLGDTQPGGFVVHAPEPGGFLVDDADGSHDEREEAGASPADHIPLTYIPTALQLLDFPPDDEDVLSVFRTAASGWQGSGRVSRELESANEQYVSRKDWRAVCAALLDTGAESVGEKEEASAAEVQDSDVNAPDEDDGGSSDEYMDTSAEQSESAEDAENSDDEYQEGGFIAPKSKSKLKATAGRAKGKATRKESKASSAIDSDDDEDYALRPGRATARQKEECRRTFALFFPGIHECDLDRQKLMIKDITRAAELLKEKITVEEVVEMLEAFSSSPDKSMSLEDFERMVIAAKLA